MKKIVVLLITMLTLTSCVAEDGGVQSDNSQNDVTSNQQVSEFSDKASDELKEIDLDISVFVNDESSESSDTVTVQPIVFPEYAHAEGIAPDKVMLIKNSYPTDHGGRAYELDGEIFDTVRAKAVDYINSVVDYFYEGKLDCDANPHLTFKYESITVSHNFISRSVNIKGIKEGDGLDKLLKNTDNILANLLDYEGFDMSKPECFWYTNESDRLCCYIYESQDSVADTVFAIQTKYVKLDFDEDVLTAITAYDMTDYRVFELDAISYEEAYNRLLAGDYMNQAFSSLNFDTANKHLIEACELKYIYHVDNFGKYYYVPVYSFYIRDDHATSSGKIYVGEFYVPAFDLEKANDMLEDEDLPLLEWK